MMRWLNRLIYGRRYCAMTEALNQCDKALRRLDVQSRALRLAMHCGDPRMLVDLVMRRLGLHHLEPLPADMVAMLSRLDGRR